jgi:phenylacetic acid degradation operon negative regulatory protein
MENPGARDLLLRLLTVAEGGRLPVTEAVKGCALFGISENNARVALTRLVTAGLVEAVERGVYRLGPRGRALGADILAWREAEQRTRAWSGAWVAAHTGALGRTDRPALRVRQRVLAMAGLRELDVGLFVRPDNIAGGVAALRERRVVFYPENPPASRQTEKPRSFPFNCRFAVSGNLLRHVAIRSVARARRVYRRNGLIGI